MFLPIDAKTYTFVFDCICFRNEKICMDSFMSNAKIYIMNLLNNDLIGNIYILSYIKILITVEL